MGLVALAIGPVVGGFVLTIAPWQVLLLVNVPIAVLAIVGVRFGIAADVEGDLHRDPADIAGAGLGTATIVVAPVAPTLFAREGARSWVPLGSRGGAGNSRPRLHRDPAAAARLGGGRRHSRPSGCCRRWLSWLPVARSSIRSFKGLVPTGPHSSAPQRWCSGWPSTAC